MDNEYIIPAAENKMPPVHKLQVNSIQMDGISSKWSFWLKRGKRHLEAWIYAVESHSDSTAYIPSRYMRFHTSKREKSFPTSGTSAVTNIRQSGQQVDLI